ncbi:MAG TPA: GNAT family protein [Parafilimonas sp.]|nr:GNAT family protein [Parafilimonas sp.]
MIQLMSFAEKDFERFVSWIDSKELLITIAGNYFSYPLIADQLRTYLDDEKSYSFNIVDTDENKIIGHAEICETGSKIFKIDKLLIGNRSSRGKGLCYPVMQALVHHAFTQLHASMVELNVFDWNTAAIKCYEKTGFKINAGKTAFFEAGDKKWIALNMQIKKLSI